mgnify:CR=1 FL=1
MFLTELYSLSNFYDYEMCMTDFQTANAKNGRTYFQVLQQRKKLDLSMGSSNMIQKND